MKKESLMLSYTAICTALVYISTCIAIPMPPPLGVWHVGDVASFIVAILFGPYIGAFACGVGAMLFDVWNPLHGNKFIVWAPATLVIRSIMGFIVGYLRNRILKKNLNVSEILAMIISHVEKNTAYFVYDYLLFGPIAYLDLITFWPLSIIDIFAATILLRSIRGYLKRRYMLR